MSDFIELLTFVVLLWYLFACLDDFAFDVYYLFYFRRHKSHGLSAKDILGRRTKTLAVMIPAWQEAGVVSEMIESTLGLMMYPEDKVHFFVGVYPNDEATKSEVLELSKRVPNVHCVVNSLAGPTKKSQNLNHVYAIIEAFEKETGEAFAGVAVHDAEDVIHPYTFRIYSALLDEHAVIQLPVFALVPKGNFWKRMVSGTYADEFAEHHLHQVPMRESLGMFVPSAGTGFIVRRGVLRELTALGPLFNEQSLTEDYELAFRLWRLGHKVHFHLQRVQRVNDDGSVKHEFVAVREYFPSEVFAAVKQKARWIYGITLQTPKLIDWATWQALPFKDRLTLWRDQKGKFTNLVHVLGYPLAAYALLGALLPLPSSQNGAIVFLGAVVLFITLERLLMRFFTVRAIYGVTEGLLASFVLPFLPLRWIIANYINMRATFRAWRLYFWPGASAPKGAAPKWDKTARKGYVSPDILAHTKRRLGDNLLFYNDVNTEQLVSLIRQQKREQQKLGEIAVEARLLPGWMMDHRMDELEREGRQAVHVGIYADDD